MKHFLFFVLICISTISNGQWLKDMHDGYSHFSVMNAKDTVNFIVADSHPSEKKPVLLFLQGSLPIPLFVEYKERNITWNLQFSNFDMETLKKTYHVVCISMPKTPVLVQYENLHSNHYYVPDTITKKIDPEFQKSDYAENYVNRAIKVLNFLRKQPWVDNSKLVVFGHSQGSRVAPILAKKYKHITHLGLFGYSPQRRIDQIVLSFRKDAEKGKITWEQADSLQQDYIQFYQNIQNEDIVKQRPAYTPWKSFLSTIDIVTHLKIPVYIANGSADVASDFCDYLPLDFVETGKKNYVIKRYAGLEHNFFPVDENGNTDYENGQWKEVLNEFIKWCED